MSIAVAVNKGDRIVLAADTQTTFGTFRLSPEHHRAAKIRRIGTALVATTGWSLYEQIFDDLLAGRKRPPSLASRASIFKFFMKLWDLLHDKYSFVNDQAHSDENSPFGDLDSSFLIVNRAGIFYVASDMSITQFEKYFAIGAGCDFAMGSLHALYDGKAGAESLARSAVSAAIDFNATCGGEIDVMSVKARPRRRA